MKVKEKKPDIGIVAFPVDEPGELSDDTKAGNVPFAHLADILHRLYRNLYVITGNRRRVLFKKDQSMDISEVRHKGGMINYIITQFKISWKVFRLNGKVSAWIFFIGAEALLLPALTAGLWRKPVVLLLTGFPARVSAAEKTRGYRIVESMSRGTLRLANRIIVYSPRIIEERQLGKYHGKTYFAQEHFLDFHQFQILKPVSRRENLVAYIGRLSEGKGITNLLEAISSLAARRSDVRFLIGGDGPLRSQVATYVNQPQIKGKIDYAGWIAHEKLPEYLNQIKLLVLPSYTEALPNILLEAMACGTPVLTTPVGAIPDIIEDGVTGFLMPENTPDVIAGNISRGLEHPGLEKIAVNACNLVREKYTCDAAVAKFQAALDNL